MFHVLWLGERKMEVGLRPRYGLVKTRIVLSYSDIEVQS